MPCLIGKLTTPQIHIENNTKMKEPNTPQPKELVSIDPHLNSSLCKIILRITKRRGNLKY